MILLIWELVFVALNLKLLKWAKSYLGEEQPEWAKMFTINGRKLWSNGELEEMRKIVNSHHSKF